VHVAPQLPPHSGLAARVELINAPFIFKDKGSPAEYGAGWRRSG
jgi:hypothetical protein